MVKTKVHHTEKYLISPQHPVTVQVIGAGGNGCQVLTQLARMDKALKGLGHTGFHVTLFDDDLISEANMGRQLFSPADIGQNKATVLITRYNRFMGTKWKAMPIRFDKKVKEDDRSANITISCVDSVQARKSIQDLIYTTKAHSDEPYKTSFYWIDLGNTQNSGQFVIGTLRSIPQPKIVTRNKKGIPVSARDNFKAVDILPDVFDKFPAFREQKDKNTGPSCSLAEALHKQDLFINPMLSQFAMHTLWRMLRETKIDYHGAFINLQSLKIAPIYL